MICILKIIMCLINGVIFVAGGAIMVIGVLVKMSSSGLLKILSELPNVSPQLERLTNVGFLMIAVGGFLAIVGFLGCCGAMCQNKCFLLLYFIIIFILFIVEVGIALMVVVSQPKVDELLQKLRSKVSSVIHDNYGGTDKVGNTLTAAWNETMGLMKCCGYNNYTDFDNSPFKNSWSVYPKSCCKEKQKCGEPEAKASNIEGCFDALMKVVKQNSVLGGLVFGVAAFQVGAMIASFCLYKN